MKCLGKSLPRVLKLFIPVSVILCFAVSFNLEPNTSAQRHNKPTPELEKSRAAAEMAMREADNLRRELSSGSNRAAEKKYLEALQLWRSINDGPAIAATLRLIGELLLDRGDRQGALGYLKESLIASRKAKDLHEETRVLNALGYLQTVLANYTDALTLLSRAHQLSLRHGNRQNEAQALSNIGETFHDMGQLDRALEYEQKALQLWRDLNDQGGQAQALLRTGYARMSMGQVEEALSAYQESLRLFKEMNLYRKQAFVLAALGHLNSQSGKKQQAISYYAQAETLCQNIEDPYIRAELSAGSGYVYYELGEMEQALHYNKQALSLYSSLSDRWAVAALHLSIGKIYLSMGEAEGALKQYQTGSALIKTLSNPRLEASLLSQSGEVFDRLGNSAEALANYTRALSLSRLAKDPRAEATTLNNIGRLRAARGQKHEAASDLKRALSLSQEISDRFTESVTLANIARLERDRGNLSGALHSIESAVRAMESLRSNVKSRDLRTSYFATIRRHYELHVDILMQLHKQQPEHGYVKSAFEISERARARSLLDSLGGQQVQGGADTELLVQPEPLRLDELQRKLLDENTLTLEYMLGDERSYGWLVSSSDILHFELPPRAGIENEVHHFYELLTANQPRPGDTIEQIAARVKLSKEQLANQTSKLSKLLLSPVATSLGTKRLLIVLDGALQRIPFQVLTVSETHRPLLLDHEIVNEPSASTLMLVLQTHEKRKTAPRTVAVFADPVFNIADSRLPSPQNGSQPSPEGGTAELTRALRDVGLENQDVPRLLSSRREADSIMSEVPWGKGLKAIGFAANRESVTRQDLAQYRIVHLATHALLNNDRPEMSGILLSLVDSSGSRQDGFLRLNDIYKLKLPVDLVVLSACQTGLGKDVKGEGLISLTRGFFYAGASGVVASLWKVDDDATAELMKHFYREMFENGRSPAAALREAQLKMYQTSRWQDPYYWAGFVIQGQYTMKDSLKQQSSSPVYVAVMGAILSLTIVFIFRRRHRRNF
jgi:CHAT domain-containing protein/tetratricopeptide (TPR) repeat protein